MLAVRELLATRCVPRWRSRTDEPAPDPIAICDRAIALAPELDEAYVVKIDELRSLGRLDEAIAVVAPRTVAVRRAIARAHAAAGRVVDACELLRGDDLLALRDLAILQRDRLDDSDAATATTRHALTRISTETVEHRRAAFDVVAMHFRAAGGDGHDGVESALHRIERWFLLAVWCDIGNSRAQAERAFSSALARSPYHPSGWYELARGRALLGDTAGALATLTVAVRDGDPSLLERARHDRDFAAVDIASIDPSPPFLALAFAQRTDPYRAKLPVRDFAGAQLELARHPEASTIIRLDRSPPTVELWMPDDALALRGCDLCRALEALAPFVDDTRFTITSERFIDEVVVSRGELYVMRGYGKDEPSEIAEREEHSSFVGDDRFYYSRADAHDKAEWDRESAQLLRRYEERLVTHWFQPEPHAARVERLASDGRIAEALEAADEAKTATTHPCARIACARATAFVAADRIDDAIDVLVAALDAGADARAAAAAAILVRDRKGDVQRMRLLCERGLAAPESCAPALELALARHTLAAFIAPFAPSEAREIRLPLVERLLVAATAAAVEGDHAYAEALFGAALARAPYHPTGHYELARARARRGALVAAADALCNAIDEADPSLLDRARTDADFAAILDDSRFAQARTLDSHALSMRGMRPPRDYDIWFPIRAGCESRVTLLDFGTRLDYILQVRDDHVELHMAGDRLYFHGWELYRAIHALAPFVEDTYGFTYNWNVGGYLDEIVVERGVLRYLRHDFDYTNHEDLRYAEIIATSEDRTVVEGAARELLDDASFAFERDDDDEDWRARSLARGHRLLDLVERANVPALADQVAALRAANPR